MSPTERRFHRRAAVSCFNGAWDLLDKKRSAAEDKEMLELAHASRYHWGLVGEPRNWAVSDWQISRVYAAVGQPELSLMFAESCLEICEEKGLSDILHTADEAMARAYAASGDFVSAKRYLREARRRLDSLRLPKDDRKVYLGQIQDTEALIH
ncbi:MAG TPA: tetratricopeptide repeat protein [Conexivisphaerales archaeon]|nr:tetratricopeptide repeat protein [Conexivisphaerales archaeon]